MADTLHIPGNIVVGFAADDGAPTAYQVDSAWVFGTSGEAVYIRFCAPEAQSNGALTAYLYCSGAPTGSPTYKAELRDSAPSGDDVDRPDAGAAALATSGDVAPAENRWATFALTGVTLVEGKYYFICVYNSHETPASNYCSWAYRGAIDNMISTATTYHLLVTGYTADGFTADGTTTTASTGCAVIKFASGAIIGMPYVADGGAHASNQNLRGMRITPSGSITVCGVIGLGTGAGLYKVAIYSGETLIVESSEMDQFGDTRAGGLRFAPTDLAAGTAYDVVFTVSANYTVGAIYTMGETEENLPADVLACRPWSCAYVDGAAAGSLTADAAKIYAMTIAVSGIPTPASGGGFTGRHMILPGI